jgi:hypothetical protein
MLARFNEQEGPLVKFRMSNMVPVGVKEDGTLVIALSTLWREAARPTPMRATRWPTRPDSMLDVIHVKAQG